MIANDELSCDTCGKKVSELRRDVIEVAYNALNKPPLWNCQDCYEEKRVRRLKERGVS
ncbi:MAG: hypothetical protein VX294_07375 [Candidatus Latescibacterota bacterium]|nr:hypothetical protein [Candidatus Latescibacterota bacterium]